MENKIVQSQVYPLEELFNSKFDVDFYQREYVWERKQMEDLLMDLSTEFLKNYHAGDPYISVDGYDPYYMGEIVLSLKSGQRSAIIDGQQRITSLTLLLIYLIRNYGSMEAFPDVSKLIYSDYFGTKMFNLDIEERRPCMLALYNNGDYVLKDDDTVSVHNIIDRYNDISDCWNEKIDSTNIIHFVYWLKAKVMFSKVWTNSDEFAYVIFETMNDRGLSLTQVEMLRSYLLANVTPNQRDKARQKYDKVVERLTAIKLGTRSKNTAICSLDDIWAIDLKKLVSYDNRIMSNMCLISSSTFVAANIGPAVVRAIASFVKNKKVPSKEIEDIITKVNIAGVGRVFIAFADNSKYFNENIHILFNNLKWNKFKAWGAGNSAESGAYQYEKGMEDILSLMTLDNTQTRFLYSIENHMLQYDIAHTKKQSVQTAKKLWYSEWKSQVSALVNEEAESYFIHDEQLLYDELYRFARDYIGRRVICVLTMELCLFQPYIPLNSENDKEYKGLKIEADYIKEHYVRRQTVVTQKDTENIRKIFKHYIGIISGSTKNVMLGAGSAGIVAVAAGAAAFTFAPGIAVAIMGNSFVGLHGVALTNASLAALGGGSIAAGGFGMAGGAAVIAGGGALAGFTGSGAIAYAASMLMTSKEYRDALYAKLLTFVKYILKEKLNDKESVIKIKHIVSYICEMAEEQLKEMKAEKTPLDKEAIELTENYVKYLRKLNAEMKKI